MIRFQPLLVAALNDMVEQEAASSLHPWNLQNLRDAHAACSVECKTIEYGPDTIGYCVVQSVMDEADLLNIVIFRPYQSRGYGFLALQALKQDLLDSGIGEVFLEVRASNSIAQALYEKAGFIVVGSRKNYYRDQSRGQQCREDALLMRSLL